MVQLKGRLVKLSDGQLVGPALLIDRKYLDNGFLEKGKSYRINFLSIPHDIIIHKKVYVNDNKTAKLFIGTKVAGHLNLEFGKEYDLELIREDPTV